MIFFLHCLSLLLFFCQSVKTSGDQCAFPFTYNGEAYFSCTMVNSNKEWCSTDSEYKGNYKYCNNGPNKDCIFPFNYKGHYYSECTLANSNSPWCSTDEEYKGNYKYCDKKPNNGPCVFPFTYKGNTYNECTLVNSNNPWCSQDKEYIGNYKYCKENPTETEKPPVVTQKPPVPETEKPPAVSKKPTVKTVKPPIPPTKKPTKDKTSTPPSSSCGEYGGRSFYFVNVEKTYFQAMEFCHNYGMVVVHVQDKNHNTWLYTKAISIKNSKWWIGLTDDDREGLYVWDDGYPLNFRAYPRGEPNNYNNEDCTEYGHYPHGLWNDIKCANRRRFICESLEKQCRAPPSSSCGTYGGRSYYFVDVVKTYSQARAFCHNYGMKVAHVRDLHHNAWLFNTARSVKRTTWYIGLTDIAREGAYVWDDGQPITFRAYPLGEPDNFGNEDCTQYGRYLFGQWNDVRCDYRQRFICEAEERQCRGVSSLYACHKHIGRTFYFVALPKSYYEARRICRAYDAVLTRSYNPAHNIWLYSTAQHYVRGSWWIGLNDIKKEGSFVFEDGHPMDWRAFFYPKEPDNLGNEDCVEIGFYNRSFWNDARCSLAKNFICESRAKKCL